MSRNDYETNYGNREILPNTNNSAPHVAPYNEAEIMPEQRISEQGHVSEFTQQPKSTFEPETTFENSPVFEPMPSHSVAPKPVVTVPPATPRSVVTVPAAPPRPVVTVPTAPPRPIVTAPVTPTLATPMTVISPEPERDSRREASYSRPYDTAEMYTPGIIRAEQMNGQHRRAQDARSKNKRHQKKKGRAGRFFRAASLVVMCALVSALAAYGVMEYRVYRGDFDPPERPEPINVGEVDSPREPDSPSVTAPTIVSPDGTMASEDIYEMALTQVVGIRSDVPRLGLFGEEGSTTPVSGSGFVISHDGYILTNYHVVEIAHRSNIPIVVSFSGGEEYYAELIGFDSLNDVALIKIEATGLNPVYIGNSDNIRVGQRIYAVGNPFGELVYTMTDGIVSALDRVVTLERNIINAFQLSAAVNSGNSGGPVYNTNGEVIGIVTAKMVRGGSVEGIGFAIPINDAIEIARGLLEFGYIPGRAFLGITADTVNRGQAESFEAVTGTLVMSVSPGSAAENAGIRERDIITKIGDVEIDSMEALRFALLGHNVGDTTTINVWRDGEEIELTVTFDEDMQAGQPNRQ